MKYRVRNWRQFQHYKDRNPPWIKLHFSMMASEDWVLLDDCSRVLAIACMLVASRNDGEIDGTERGLAYLHRVAYLSDKPNLNPLIECGFLESASGCKQALADARRSVSPSVSVVTEVTKEETKKKRGEATRGTRLQQEWRPSESNLAYCRQKRPDLDPEVVAENFKDYWLSVPGQRGVKLDWDRTWNKWVRDEKSNAKSGGASGGAGRPVRVEDTLANLRRLAGDEEGGEGLDSPDGNVRGAVLEGVWERAE